MDELRRPVDAGHRWGTALGRIVIPVFIALAVVAGACAGRPAPLNGAVESPEGIAQTLLDALARRDEAALRSLALSEHEFRTVVWPSLPASRPEMNVPFEYAWGTLAQNSQGYLASLLQSHGGRRYALVALEFAGETTRYDGFTVHRDSRLVVRDDAGREQRLALFGALLEQDGRYKVFSYVSD
jgi:hypothetical protein